MSDVALYRRLLRQARPYGLHLAAVFVRPAGSSDPRVVAYYTLSALAIDAHPTVAAEPGSQAPSRGAACPSRWQPSAAPPTSRQGCPPARCARP